MKDTEYLNEFTYLYNPNVKETWAFDYVLAEYLSTRLKLYKQATIVDLDYPDRFEYNGKKYTQRELIDEIIKRCDAYVEDNAITNHKATTDMIEAIHMLAEIYTALWW